MKKLIAIAICLSWIIGVSAQTPNTFKYQAVVRDNAGQVFDSKTVGFRISILQTSPTGAVVFSETHSAQTNAFGLVNLEIGNGTIVSGTFSGIDWGSDSYFVKIELDSNNSGIFTEMGTSQLLSVPYALYAKQSGNGLTISGAAQPGDILYHNGASWVILSKGLNGQTLRLDDEKPNWAEPGFALPIVTTAAPTDVMVNAATTGGHIIATGFTDITAKGVCWAITQNPTIENDKTNDTDGIGAFSSQLNELQPNTTYYARAYATNGAGTAYGNQISFKTFQNVVFPTVTTAATINITETAAASGGNVTATGGAEVIAKGICWSTNQNPTVADHKTDEGAGTGLFNSHMDNLNPGTIYYVRAYATNSAGTGYGAQITLTTLKTAPTIITKNISSITAMGGVSGGTITLTGGGTISDKGICWGESENPTIYDNKISAGTGNATFNSAISLLKPNTTCYVRAYAVNEIGIAYGDQKTFTTSDAFYDGFETGFSGNTGGWGIVTGDAVEGAYSLRSAQGGAEATLTKTLLNPGHISFYFKNIVGSYSKWPSITFIIDDITQATITNSSWLQVSYPVSEGTHTFKWKFNTTAYGGAGLIDFIVMPK